jgi:hypothetical protein
MIHVRLHASVPGHDLRQTVGKSRFFGQLYQFDGATFREVPPIAIVQKITHWPDAFVHPFVQEGGCRGALILNQGRRFIILRVRRLPTCRSMRQTDMRDLHIRRRRPGLRIAPRLPGARRVTPTHSASA